MEGVGGGRCERFLGTVQVPRTVETLIKEVKQVCNILPLRAECPLFVVSDHLPPRPSVFGDR